MQWNKPTKLACALGATALYFSAALGLKYSYAPPAEPPGKKILLHRPFADLATSVPALVYRSLVFSPIGQAKMPAPASCSTKVIVHWVRHTPHTAKSPSWAMAVSPIGKAS